MNNCDIRTVNVGVRCIRLKDRKERRTIMELPGLFKKAILRILVESRLLENQSGVFYTFIRAMKDKFGGKLYGRFGFGDAFNSNKGGVNPDVIDINVALLCNAENSRSENIWQWFTANEEILCTLNRVGLHKQ